MFEQVLAEANRIDMATKKKIGNTERFMSSINRVADRDTFGEPKVKPKEKPCRVCNAQLFTDGEKRNIPPLRYQKYDFICKSCVRRKSVEKRHDKESLTKEQFAFLVDYEMSKLQIKIKELLGRLNDSSQKISGN